MSARSRPAELVRRPSRAVPAGLLAVALLIAGAVGVWLLGTYLITDAWPAAANSAVASVGDTRLDAVAVQVAAVILAVVGLAMLLAALVPGRPARVQVLDDAIPGETAMSRRDVAHLVQQRTEHVDGVQSVRTQVGRRRVEVSVVTTADDTAPVLGSATAAVERALAELRPAGNLVPRVRVHRRS